MTIYKYFNGAYNHKKYAWIDCKMFDAHREDGTANDVFVYEGHAYCTNGRITGYEIIFEMNKYKDANDII